MDLDTSEPVELTTQVSAVEGDGGGGNSGDCVDADTPPNIIPRSGWGGRPAAYLQKKHTVRTLVMHHTVQPLSSSLRGAAAVRSAQDYHINTNGWADIGYHYLIDRAGNIYAGADPTRIGTHVGGQNTGKLGISLIGNFETGPKYAGEPLGSAQKNAAALLIRHLSKKHNIALSTSDIKGHDHYARGRICPGKNVSVSELIQLAGSERICSSNPTNPAPTPPPTSTGMEYELPDIPLYTDGKVGYNKLRLTHIEGGEFVIDGVYHQKSGGEKVWTNKGSGDGIDNLSGAYDEADVKQCSDLSSLAAKLQPGGVVTFDFPKSLEVSSNFYIRGQSVGSLPDREDCDELYDSLVKVEGSIDGDEWDVLNPATTTNSTISATLSSFDMVEPAGDQSSRKTTFRVTAPKGVVSVKYYAEKWSLGSSTKADDGFVYTYEFQDTGKRLISAWGFDKFGRAIAMMERFITITDGIDFMTPNSGKKYEPQMLLKVATSDDVRRVVYKFKGKIIGESTSKGDNFQIEHFFEEYGRTLVEAIGYDRNGEVYATTNVTFDVSEAGKNFRITAPRGESAYTKSVDFKMEVSDPAITRVQYVVDGIHSIGSSTSPSDEFGINYTFTDTGRRKIEAKGFNQNDEHIATDTLFIIVTEDDGTAPSSGDYDPAQDPNSPESVGIQHDTATANRLAIEATKLRDRNGNSPVGRGYCYKFVKAAMHRADVPRQSSYNASFSEIDVGACRAINAQNSGANLTMTNSAMCFGRNAAANASGLFSEFGMQQVMIPVTQALPGDVITYDSLCLSSVHGHIEIVDPDGRVCSDFCTSLSSRASVTRCTPQIWRAVTSVSGGNQPPASSSTPIGSSCFFNGDEGTCLRNGSACGGSEGQSTCSPGQKCCVKGCSVRSTPGQCVASSSCGGTSTPNLCPGPSNVQCCTP